MTFWINGNPTNQTMLLWTKRCLRGQWVWSLLTLKISLLEAKIGALTPSAAPRPASGADSSARVDNKPAYVSLTLAWPGNGVDVNAILQLMARAMRWRA